MYRRITGICILVLLAISAPLQPAFAEASPPDCGSPLCRFVASGSLSTLRRPGFAEHRTRIQSFYASIRYTFAWSTDGRATGQAKAVIQVLTAAEAEGLNPEDYDGPRWEDRLAKLHDTDKPPSELDLAAFDLALTVCLTRYVSDLHFGRADPGLFHVFAGADGGELDIPGFLLQRLIHATDVKTALAAIEPPYEGYRRTQQALQRYIALAREDHGGLLPVPKKPVDPGGSYAAAMQLADLLRRLGDLSPQEAMPLDTYAGPLVDAVKRFQVRHGLESDGRLGKATLAQLNLPLKHRVRQLQLALERWRWAPHNFPRPPVVVNIPEFALRALDGSNRTGLEMKVVVGKAYRHQTPVFAADMKQVIFRPYWNVPLSIQRAELVPKLAQDPSYLAKNHYEAVTPENRVVTNGTLDAATLAQLRSGKLRLRQSPGPGNALGLVMFRFPNKHNVYLHGTPDTVLFSKSRRDFSHGCIRAEKPRQLAAWVLRDQPEWTPERIAEAMNGTKTIQVPLVRPVPVLIVYATAVVLESGEVRFFQDIYGQDAELENRLAARYASAISVPCPRPFKRIPAHLVGDIAQTERRTGAASLTASLFLKRCGDSTQ